MDENSVKIYSELELPANQVSKIVPLQVATTATNKHMRQLRDKAEFICVGTRPDLSMGPHTRWALTKWAFVHIPTNVNSHYKMTF